MDPYPVEGWDSGFRPEVVKAVVRVGHHILGELRFTHAPGQAWAQLNKGFAAHTDDFRHISPSPSAQPERNANRPQIIC
jgi:hypothetical protein